MPWDGGPGSSVQRGYSDSRIRVLCRLSLKRGKNPAPCTAQGSSRAPMPSALGALLYDQFIRCENRRGRYR